MFPPWLSIWRLQGFPAIWMCRNGPFEGVHHLPGFWPDRICVPMLLMVTLNPSSSGHVCFLKVALEVVLSVCLSFRFVVEAKGVGWFGYPGRHKKKQGSRTLDGRVGPSSCGRGCLRRGHLRGRERPSVFFCLIYALARLRESSTISCAASYFLFSAYPVNWTSSISQTGPAIVCDGWSMKKKNCRWYFKVNVFPRDVADRTGHFFHGHFDNSCRDPSLGVHVLQEIQCPCTRRRPYHAPGVGVQH